MQGRSYAAIAAPVVLLFGWVLASPAAEPPATIWRFLGIPQGINKVRDATFNRQGRLPGLERKPPLKAIADPANLESKNPAIKKAAEIKQEEDLAKQKIKALKYLAEVGCGCYPGVKEALMAALDDCTEKVRYQAARQMGKAAESKCEFCSKNCCCDEELTKKLAEVAYEKDEKGCWLEESERVREAAAEALRACCQASRDVGGETIPPPPTPVEVIPPEPQPTETIPDDAPPVPPEDAALNLQRRLLPAGAPARPAPALPSPGPRAVSSLQDRLLAAFRRQQDAAADTSTARTAAAPQREPTVAVFRKAQAAAVSRQDRAVAPTAPAPRPPLAGGWTRPSVFAAPPPAQSRAPRDALPTAPETVRAPRDHEPAPWAQLRIRSVTRFEAPPRRRDDGAASPHAELATSPRPNDPTPVRLPIVQPATEVSKRARATLRVKEQIAPTPRPKPTAAPEERVRTVTAPTTRAAARPQTKRAAARIAFHVNTASAALRAVLADPEADEPAPADDPADPIIWVNDSTSSR